MENRLRPYFLLLLITFTILVTAASAIAILRGAPTVVWLPVAVASAQVWIFFLRLHVAHVPRTTPGLLGITIGVFLATVYALYQSHRAGSASVGPLLAFASLGGWVAYIMWYSDLDRSNDRIKVGKRLPTLRLTDVAGKEVALPPNEGNRALIIFFRGNWCPICTAQLIELAQRAGEFTNRGVSLYAISPQPLAHNVLMAERLNGKVHLLHDTDNTVALQLGLVQAGAVPINYTAVGYPADAPKPTALFIDAKGQIIWCDQPENYRLRPRIEEILEGLDGK